jgi:two-component system, chemotaxis family, protein-glutamate methylesterase/glutaminase
VKIVVLGGSLGCLPVVQGILSHLEPAFAAALVIVVHRLSSREDLLTPLLQRCCALPVTEALDKAPLLAGHVYVAPADYHVLVERDYLTLSIDDPVHYARPSIDVLFESAALAWGAEVIAVALTGSGSDGAAGAAMIEARGGRVLIEDPATAFRADLPAAVRASTCGARLLPAQEIGTALSSLLTAAD